MTMFNRNGDECIYYKKQYLIKNSYPIASAGLKPTKYKIYFIVYEKYFSFVLS